MIKDYIPFIIFASVIAIFTVIFIVKGNMSGDDDADQSNESEDADSNQDQ